MVWNGSLAQLNQFIQLLNVNSMNLHFTVNLDDTQIPFLDLLIIKNPDETLGTDLYRKPTAGNTLLYAYSAHPKLLVYSIPYVQYLQLSRNCTREEDFYIQAASLHERLLLRGRTSCTNTVKIITKFSAHRGQLCDIFSKHWHLLTSS